MKKTICLIFVLFSVSVFSQKTTKTSIDGVIIGLDNGKIYLEYFDYYNNPIIDSTITTKDGGFKFNTLIKTYGFYRINYNQSKTLVVLKPEEKISITIDPAQNYMIVKSNGSEEIKQMVDFQTFDKSLKNKQDSINKVFQQNNEAGNTSLNQKLQQDYQNVEIEKIKAYRELVLKKPSLLSNLIIIEHLPFDQHFDIHDTVYKLIYPKFPDNVFVAELHKKINSQKSSQIGQIAPEIALPDTLGNIVKLSSLRGKYVLIDFWASWCSPCRKENPNLLRVYNRFKDKNFQIYGVSLDKSGPNWRAAIIKDNIPWIHVSDLKYWESEAGALYGVKSIPYSVLIDPNGKIIQKGLRADDLEKLLETILK